MKEPEKVQKIYDTIKQLHAKNSKRMMDLSRAGKCGSLEWIILATRSDTLHEIMNMVNDNI